MSATKKQARTAGFIYLLLAIFGSFGVLYVPSTIIVSGDAAATASNIASSELLFRAGILSSLISNVIFVFLALALYRLFKGINHRHALLMVTLVVVAASAGFLHELNQTAALIVLNSPDILSVFDQPQLEALSYFFLRLHSHGLQALQMFWGLWLFPFGLLVYKSGFIPKFFGVLLIAAGFGYLLSCITFLVFPQFNDAIYWPATVLQICELPIIFWLLIVGAKTQTAAPNA